MSTPNVDKATPGAVVPLGNLVTPGGKQGVPGKEQNVDNYVTLDTDQTIIGVKTFTVSSPVGPMPTEQNEFTIKQYVDARLANALDPWQSLILLTLTTGQPTGACRIRRIEGTRAVRFFCDINCTGGILVNEPICIITTELLPKNPFVSMMVALGSPSGWGRCTISKDDGTFALRSISEATTWVRVDATWRLDSDPD